MPLRFFTIPLQHGSDQAEALNHCLATQRVAQVEKHLVIDGAASCWAVCVTVAEGDAPARDARPGAAGRRGQAVDWREHLAPEEFALYDRLRSERKRLADADGLPTYAVFTNDQLAAMVRQRATTAEALGAIDGIGEGRITRYAAAVLPLLREAVPRLGPAAAEPPMPPAADAAPAATPGRSR